MRAHAFVLYFRSALESMLECDAVGIFKLASCGNAVSQASHLESCRPQKTGDVHGGRFALGVGVGRHDDLFHIAFCHTGEQFSDADVVGSDVIER